MRAFGLEGMTVSPAAAVFCTPASGRHDPAGSGAAADPSPSKAGVNKFSPRLVVPAWASR